MKLVPIAFLIAAALGGSTAAQAGQQQGVRCPDGTTAKLSNASSVLRCTTEEPVEREAFCSPVAFGKQANLDVNARVIHHTNGRDYCSNPTGNVRANVQYQPLPGDPPANQFQHVTLPGKDVFRATKINYHFPTGGPIYNPMHKASLGVRCQSGWDGDSVFNDTGIRCDRNDGAPRDADCDTLWTRDNDARGEEDRCKGPNEGPTKPRGMTKVQHDAERALDTVGWVLDKRPGVDRWQRKVYAYPVSSN
jgi:hypothetical protein